jgi:RNA polymerase sigma factor (sigma-70 family)
MTDGELLNNYVEKRDEAAFAELVRRHAAMVYGTARRCAGDDDADDIAQAVFLLMSRRGPSLARHPSLAGWLYKTTQLCAANACRTRRRRAIHLHAAQAIQAQAGHIAPSEQENIETRETLNAGLARLHEKQREVVLLRYIEGLSLEETAARVRVSREAVAKRAERGLSKLREFLVGRGVSVTPAAVISVLQSQGAALPEITLQQLTAAAKAGSMSPGALSLATIASRAIAMKTTLIASACVLGGIATVIAGSALVASNRAPSANARVPASSASSATKPAPTTAPALTQDSGKATAIQLMKALASRDEAAVANLLMDADPEQRRAKAVTLIRTIRDGWYARFPQRLTQITNTSFTSQQNGAMTEATLGFTPPTLADVRHATVRLKPLDGQWRVQEIVFGNGDPMSMDAAVVDTSATTRAASRVPLETYAKAAEVLRAMEGRVAGMDPQKPLPEKDVSRVLEGLELAKGDVRKLAEVLKPTDMAMDDETLRVVEGMLDRWHEVLAKSGPAALLQAMKTLEQDAAYRKVGMSPAFNHDELTKRADAEADALHTDVRPPSFAPGVELTLAWDGSKQTIPGPVKMPEWFRQSAAFKQWQKHHDIRTFRTKDDAGNVYEIACQGAVKMGDGRMLEMIPLIRQHRADGTLAAEACYYMEDGVTSWSLLDATGTRYVLQVNMHQGAIYRVSFFDEKCNQRVWESLGHKDNTMAMEQVTDPIGDHAKVTNAEPPKKKEPAIDRNAADRL